MLVVDNIIINQNVLETKFTCDLKKCKGACCTMESQYGAPLKKSEIKVIEQILPEVLVYLPEEHKQEILDNGFWREEDGVYMTTSIDDRACVFVYFENEIAKCAIEKAFHKGKVSFQKPISCHLFPIRVTEFAGPILNYEEYIDCKPALELGKVTGIKVIDFCQDSLKREYGNEWVQKVKESTR